MTLPKTDIQRPSPEELLKERILLLDGGFGTMVQGYGLTEEAFRGERFRGWEVQLKGCNDLLAVTRPDVVREIHEKYLRAGADIIETDSFNANAISLVAIFGFKNISSLIKLALGYTQDTLSTFGNINHSFAIDFIFERLCNLFGSTNTLSNSRIENRANCRLVKTEFSSDLSGSFAILLETSYFVILDLPAIMLCSTLRNTEFSRTKLILFRKFGVDDIENLSFALATPFEFVHARKKIA